MKNSFQHYSDNINLIQAGQKFEHEPGFRQNGFLKRERKNECGNLHPFIVDWQIPEGAEKVKEESL